MSQPNTTKDCTYTHASPQTSHFVTNLAVLATDWEKRWQEGNTPWDHGESSQAFIELLKEQASLIPTKGNVLVPGCGKGYDCFLLASPERKVYGLDLSETCIAKCHKVRLGGKGISSVGGSKWRKRKNTCNGSLRGHLTRVLVHYGSNNYSVAARKTSV